MQKSNRNSPHVSPSQETDRDKAPDPPGEGPGGDESIIKTQLDDLLEHGQSNASSHSPRSLSSSAVQSEAALVETSVTSAHVFPSNRPGEARAKRMRDEDDNEEDTGRAKSRRTDREELSSSGNDSSREIFDINLRQQRSRNVQLLSEHTTGSGLSLQQLSGLGERRSLPGLSQPSLLFPLQQQASISPATSQGLFFLSRPTSQLTSALGPINQHQHLSAAANSIVLGSHPSLAIADQLLLHHLTSVGQSFMANPSFMDTSAYQLPSFQGRATSGGAGPNQPGAMVGSALPLLHSSAIMATQIRLPGRAAGATEGAAQLPGGHSMRGPPASTRGGTRTPAGRLQNTRSSHEGLESLRRELNTESIGPDVPMSLPAIIAFPDDANKLSAFQLLLREQIEVFTADAEDVSTHARGRNRPITLGQVGIRCSHCSEFPVHRRKKGSVYFPFSLIGLYQAAQNMGSAHFSGEGCHTMPDELKKKFVEVLACKSTVGSGKQYWASSAQRLGLLDSDQGIRFIRDLVSPPPAVPN